MARANISLGCLGFSSLGFAGGGLVCFGVGQGRVIASKVETTRFAVLLQCSFVCIALLLYRSCFCFALLEPTWLETKWLEPKWLEPKWPELKWLELKWLETKWLEPRWPKPRWPQQKWLEPKWSEPKWPEPKGPAIILVLMAQSKVVRWAIRTFRLRRLSIKDMGNPLPESCVGLLTTLCTRWILRKRTRKTVFA